jgi:hypothetical protein
LSVFMTADDLGQPVVLSFRTTGDDGRLALDLQQLAALWGGPAGQSRVGRDDWLRAWRNIGVLASRLFDTLDPLRRCDPETFHHLLLAVGNFKRQAGIHVPVDSRRPYSPAAGRIARASRRPRPTRPRQCGLLATPNSNPRTWHPDRELSAGRAVARQPRNHGRLRSPSGRRPSGRAAFP